MSLTDFESLSLPTVRNLKDLSNLNLCHGMEPSLPENIARAISLLEERIDQLDKKVNEINERVNKRIDILDASVEEVRHQLERLRIDSAGDLALIWTHFLMLFLALISRPENLLGLIEEISQSISTLERLKTFDSKTLRNLRSDVLKVIIQKASEIKCDVGDLAERLVKHFGPSELLSPEVKNLVRKNFRQEGLEIWEKIVK